MKKIAILTAILLALTLSCMSQPQTLSNHINLKNGMSSDSIGSYTGDSLIIDGEGLLKFSDDIAGEYTLSELAAGGGDVTKVGTPVDNQVGIWTGDGTIEGDADVTWNGSYFLIGTSGNPQVYFTYDQVHSLFSAREGGNNHAEFQTNSNTAVHTNKLSNHRFGGTISSALAAPTDAIVKEELFYVYDGTLARESGKTVFQVDGAIATDDFDTKYEWFLKEGASANAVKMSLDQNGLDVVESLDVGGNVIATGYMEAANFEASGGNNTFVGQSVNHPTGTYNTIVGNSSGNTTSFAGSTLVGALAGQDIAASVVSVVGIGNNAFNGATTPNYSIAIGQYAGAGADGDSCVYLGLRAGLDNDTDSQLYIDNSNTSTPLIHGDFNTDELTVNGDLDVIGSITGKDIMFVERAQVLYTNTTQTTIIILPTDAVIWDIQVEVTTAFNGTAGNLLDIGVTGTGNRYEDDLDISSTGFKTMTLTNVPDRMTGSTNITFQHFDSGADASAGEGYVYIHYSLH